MDKNLQKLSGFPEGGVSGGDFSYSFMGILTLDICGLSACSFTFFNGLQW